MRVISKTEIDKIRADHPLASDKECVELFWEKVTRSQLEKKYPYPLPSREHMRRLEQERGRKNVNLVFFIRGYKVNDLAGSVKLWQAISNA